MARYVNKIIHGLLDGDMKELGHIHGLSYRKKSCGREIHFDNKGSLTRDTPLQFGQSQSQ